MNTHQATYETALERLERKIETAFERMERRLAEHDAAAARRDAEFADRIATTTERMASSRWWPTAIMIAVVALVGTVVTGLPVLPEILSGLAAR
ncbi:MAG: hypothetical protein F4103_08315 [Boseongicola sp. SB0673_bin_14]|nr:hypothetical protein [Gammaproteobacteria bacterium]MYI68729.1 hypothetical protein [Boseongicola sp. SB0673_bin_14]